MQLQENEHIELKKSAAELKDALKSISAMLNKHKKGTIYFNVNSGGVPVKNDVSDKTLRKISQIISDKIEPRIYPHISIEKIKLIDVIKIQFEGAQMPYSAEGRYYIRVADEDRQMSQAQLKQFILKNKDLRWDSL
ncbi:MAG: ATP-binding protein, partial [Chlorobi bacterium]|nr:ATP-binding protein [Chlorobiota bacterium]